MALHSRKIFVDSSIFISFIDRADNNHARAVKSIETLAQLGYQVYTSSLVVNDVYALISREISPLVSLDFLQAIIQSDIEIIFPQKVDLITAHRMLRSNKERQIPFREVMNATLMQRKNIAQVLTFNYWHNLFGSYVSNFGS